jgi:tetratricopeptide (TPR) repeat protein
VLHKLGKLREAANLTQRALGIERSKSGAFHPRVAVRLGNLGRILRDAADLSSSAQHMREALAIEEKVYGSDHPRIATICDELGGILHTSGDLAGALIYAQRALDIDTKSFGPTHEQVAIDEHNIALLYLDVGRAPDAAAHLYTALAILGRSGGTEHPLFQHVTEILSSLGHDGMELQSANR